MIKYFCDKCDKELPEESDRYTRIISSDVHVVRTYLFCYKCDKAFWEHLCLFTKKNVKNKEDIREVNNGNVFVLQ